MHTFYRNLQLVLWRFLLVTDISHHWRILFFFQIGGDARIGLIKSSPKNINYMKTCSSSFPRAQCLTSGLHPEFPLLWQLPAAQGRSVPAPAALSPGEKPSEHLESWRTQAYYTGKLRGDRSPLSGVWAPKKGFTRLLWATSAGSMLGWLDQSDVRQGSRCRNKFTEADVWGRGGWDSWLDFP